MGRLMLLSLPILIFLVSSSFGDDRTLYAAMKDKIKWPAVCTDHPWAIKATAGEFNDDAGALCSLTFPYYADAKRRHELCSDLFYDRVVSHSGDAFTTTCNYKRTSQCREGQIMVRGMCFRLHEKMANTFSDAERECRAEGATVAGDVQFEDLKYILYLANPIIYGFDVKTVWLSKDAQMVFRRNLDYSLPGQRVTSSSPARFYCATIASRLRSGHKEFCEFAEKSLNLKAYYEMGSCFILSPSLYMDLGTRGNAKKEEKMRDFAHFNQDCRWLSDSDYAVSPLSNVRVRGMQGLIQKYNLPIRPILPAFKSEGNNFYILNREVDAASEALEKVTDGAFLWARDQSMEIADLPLTGAVMLGKQSNYKLQKVPAFFRGHRICSTGVTNKEAVNIQDCNDPNSADARLRKGWTYLRRDDGKGMCIKAFIKDLDPNNKEDPGYECKTFDELDRFCKSMPDTFISPVQSREEQTKITELVWAHMKEVQEFEIKHNTRHRIGQKAHRSVYLGGRKVDNMRAINGDAKFIWDYDGQDMVYKNWRAGEPNNGGSNNRYDAFEYCVEMTMPWQRGADLTWVDVKCDMRCSGSWEHDIMGVVCARIFES